MGTTLELTPATVSTLYAGRTFTDSTGTINALDFHHTEDLLATSGDDETIRVYNTASGELARTLYSKKYGVAAIRFTHHADAVLTASKNAWDHTVRYLSLHDNRYMRYFKGHRGAVVDIATHPTGEHNDLFLTASADKTVRIWELRANACQGMLRCQAEPPAVAVDPNGGLVFAVATTPDTVALYNMSNYDAGPFNEGFKVPAENGARATVTGLSFSLDGKLLMVTSTQGVYVLDAITGEQKFATPLEPAEPVTGTVGAPGRACLSPDGKFVVAGGSGGGLRVWSLAMNGAEVTRPGEGTHPAAPSIVAWAPRRMLLASSAGSSLALWAPKLTPPSLAGP